MQYQDYCHYSQTKAHRADLGQSTQSPMRVPQKYRVQLGFLGALGNPVQTAQVSVTVASAQVQMQVLKLVVREWQEIHDAGQMGGACLEQLESACLPLWLVVRHSVLVSKVSVLTLLNVRVIRYAEVAALLGNAPTK
jgi:hypothetical protein